MEQPSILPASFVRARPAGGTRAELRDLVPAHRIPVIAKTPLLVAIGAYGSGARIGERGVAATMALTALLWALLYAVNEATDLEAEQGRIVQPALRSGLVAACCLLCTLGARLSPALGLLMAAMAAGQLLYCIPPFRLKRYWWAVILLSGAVNPVLRLSAGALWGAHPVPLTLYAAVALIHLGASSRSRTLLRSRDAGFGYRIAPDRTELAGMVFTVLGLALTAMLACTRVLPRQFLAFGLLAAPFSLYAWWPGATSMPRLRYGWIWFALLSVVALAMLGR